MWLTRVLPVVMLLVGLSTVGVDVSAAAPGQPNTAAVTVPAATHPAASSRPRSGPDGTTASATSGNWSGYVATGGTYTSVSASWIVPWGDVCLSSGDGVEASWVGLDGWNDGTVEQTGIIMDCTKGYPQYYAWWETVPTQPVVQKYGVAVDVDDSITATVTYDGSGTYDLLLTDNTQGWTENNVVAGPPGAQNASAEIITEAATVNGTISHLPNYWVEPYTGATIDGGTLQAADAQPVTMLNSSNAVVSSTAAADSSGDFNNFYGTSTNPDTFYECTGGETDSSIGVLYGAGGCTGPYGSAAPYLINIVDLTDMANVYDGTVTVYCPTIGASDGTVSGGDCSYF